MWNMKPEFASDVTNTSDKLFVSSDHPRLSGSDHHAEFQPVQPPLVCRWRRLQTNRRSVALTSLPVVSVGFHPVMLASHQTYLICSGWFDDTEAKWNSLLLSFQLFPETSWQTPPPPGQQKTMGTVCRSSPTPRHRRLKSLNLNSANQDLLMELTSPRNQ